MKNIKITFFLLASILFSGTIIAQSIESVYLTLPSIRLDDGMKIYIAPLENNSEENNDFSTSFSTSVKSYLSNGQVSKYNPWLTTGIYNVVESAEEANYIIDGNYAFKGNSSQLCKRVETTTKDKYPIEYVVFVNSSMAELTGNVNIKRGTEVLNTINISGSKSDSKEKALSRPGMAKQPNSMYSGLEKAAMNKIINSLLPGFTAVKYSFNKCKTKNKEAKKAYKDKEDQASDFIKGGKVKEGGRAYIELSKIDDTDDEVYFNIGMCYELIGNLSKAEEFYAKSTAKDVSNAKKRLTNLKQAQEYLKNRGIDFIEQDF